MPDYYTSQFSGEEIDAALRAAQMISGASTPAELRNKLEIYGSNTALSPTDSTTVETALKYRCNPNLLDNWYFARPVNQRGKTEPEDVRYMIDRWRINYVTKMQVLDGYIRITGQNDVSQIFDEDFLSTIRGKTVTFSVLYRNTNGTVSSSAGTLNDTTGKWVLAKKTYTFATDGTAVYMFLGDNPNSSSCEFLAAKLELGDTQTLAHKEGDTWVLNEIPDYGEQLRRCQRYAIKIGKDTAGDSSLVGFALCTSSTLASAFISLPVSMRTKPSVTFKNVYLSLGSSVVAVTNITVYENTQNGIYCALSVSGGLTVGQTVAIRTSDGGYIMPSADL